MKNIKSICIGLLLCSLASLAQIKVYCPSNCRPYLSCNTCWTSAQEALDQGCSVTAVGNEALGVSTLEIYPNPSAQGSFIIENQQRLSATVDILDQTGKVVASFNLGPEKNHVFEGFLHPGMYLIRFDHMQNNTVIHKKLIVK